MGFSLSDAYHSVSDFGQDLIDHPLETVGAALAAPFVAAGATIVAGGTTALGVATAIAPAAAGGMSAYEQHEAAKLAKEQGQANADAAAAYTAEQVRVLTEENERTESLARATAAASGLSGASSELYISALEESGREDIDWLKQLGEFSYNAAISQGESAYHSAQAAMWGSIGGATSGGIGSIAAIAGL